MLKILEQAMGDTLQMEGEFKMNKLGYKIIEEGQFKEVSEVD
jgi:hypothetical protein